MKIELKAIKIRALTNGYEDNEEDGVVGVGNKLDIRPPYQREFIYNDKQRDAVINKYHNKRLSFKCNVLGCSWRWKI